MSYTLTTPGDIAAEALMESGVLGEGQVASATDLRTAMFRLNMMLAQWNRKRFLVYHLVDVACQATGAESYTVGTGGDFNVMRPDKLESGFYRQTNSSPSPLDYPMRIISAREDYNRISLKELGTWPRNAFYDAAYPMGILYPYPVPSNLFEIHITVKETLTQFTSAAQTVSLPPEYIPALFYNLAARLRSAYQMPPDPTIVALAKDSLNVIRGANTSVPLLQLPRALGRNGSRYNMYSDNN